MSPSKIKNPFWEPQSSWQQQPATYFHTLFAPPPLLNLNSPSFSRFRNLFRCARCSDTIWHLLPQQRKAVRTLQRGGGGFRTNLLLRGVIGKDAKGLPDSRLYISYKQLFEDFYLGFDPYTHRSYFIYPPSPNQTTPCICRSTEAQRTKKFSIHF